MKVKELIDLMPRAIYLSDNLEDIYKWLTKVCGNDIRKVANGLNPSKDLYVGVVVATDVYQCEDGYVGIRSVFYGEEFFLDTICVIYGEVKRVNDWKYQMKYFNRAWKRCKHVYFKEDLHYERKIRMYSLFELKEVLVNLRKLQAKYWNWSENEKLEDCNCKIGLVIKECQRRILCNIEY